MASHREFAATEGEETTQDVLKVGWGLWANLFHKDRCFYCDCSQFNWSCEGGVIFSFHFLHFQYFYLWISSTIQYQAPNRTLLTVRTFAYRYIAVALFKVQTQKQQLRQFNPVRINQTQPSFAYNLASHSMSEKLIYRPENGQGGQICFFVCRYF